MGVCVCVNFLLLIILSLNHSHVTRETFVHVTHTDICALVKDFICLMSFYHHLSQRKMSYHLKQQNEGQMHVATADIKIMTDRPK